MSERDDRGRPAVHGVVRWRLADLMQWLRDEYRIRISKQTSMTLVPLPAKAPELSPVENIWQFMRESWISNRVFTSYNGILDHCCAAWNKLIDQPWTIMSIGLRDWARQ